MIGERVVLVAGIRTPFCKAGSNLASLTAADLGKSAASALLSRTGIDAGHLDEVIVGCVAQPADSMNLARVIALRAGVPKEVPALTVHRNCASGFEAVTQAWLRIRAGEGKLYLVGGVESMSNIPLLFPKSAAGKFVSLGRAKSPVQKIGAMASFRPVDFAPQIGLKLGLSDAVAGLNMGETAEILAREFGISREEQDIFALRSHQKAAAAAGRLAEEIAPSYDTRKGKAAVQDNGVRPEQTMQALAKLQPVFERDTGTVTAGNSSQITDGAVFLLVSSESEAEKLGIEPLGVLRGYAYAGCDPARMGLGPVPAIKKLLERSKLTLADADLVEINEAFAAQVLSVLKNLKSEGMEVPDDRLNVNGGGIALGHPVGASGARLILTALKELKRRNGKNALASLCVGGGQGGAVWLEAYS